MSSMAPMNPSGSPSAPSRRVTVGPAPHFRAVLAQVALLERQSRDAAVEQLLHRLPAGADVVGVCDVEKRAVTNLVLGVAEDLGALRVGLDEASSSVLTAIPTAT
jgi:hypothetical protein